MRAYRNTWALIGILSVLLASSGCTNDSDPPVVANTVTVSEKVIPERLIFVPPDEASIPDDQYGDVVRYGKSLFFDTQQLKQTYVGNGMNCRNCHLDNGRQADSSPLWAAHGMYPAYRKKNDHVNTYEERLQGCFTYSMNGTPPASGSKELTALIAYSYWMSEGVPLGKEMPGRGYPELAEAAQSPDTARGELVYKSSCAICHGDQGQGMKSGEAYVYPPLWGNDSFNWGAGMHRINTSANFIKANMPFGTPNTLTDQQAWDVAAFMNDHERQQDPRFKGDVAETKKEFHAHQCFYGESG
jgi:thiosulfate dehydrogenase